MTLRVITGVLGPVFAIASSALCLLLAWGWMSAQTAAFKALPRVSALSALTVTKQDTVTQPESAVALGWRELMQNPGAESAEDRHLQITFSPQGEALLRNMASQRRIALRYADGTSLTDRAYLLKDGDRFRLSGTWFTASVPEDGSGALSIIGAGRTATLPRGYFTAQKGDLDWISHSVSIGGNLSHDPKSWGETWEVADWIRILLRRREAGPILMPIEQLAPDTVRVERINTHYVLRAREAGHVAVCPKDAACFELGRQSWHTFHPVFGALRSVTIGRTSYSVAAQENEITFKPVARGHWINRDTFEKIRTERAPAATRGSVITSQWRGLGKGPPAQTNAERILRSVQSFYQNEGPAVMLVLAVLFGLSCLSHAGAQSIGTTRTVALVFFAIAAAPGVATLPFGLSLSAAGLFCMALMFAALLRQVWRIATGSGEGWRPRSLIMRIAHGRFTDYLIVGLALLALLLMSAQPSGSVTGPGAELGPALIALITLFAIAGVCICMLFQRPAVVVFWVSLMIIAGIGIYVQSALVFGQGSARYVILFERHVTVFALLCLFAVSLATAPRTRAISMFEQAIGFAGRDLRMNLLRLGLVLCVALPGLLLTFTSLAFPQALPLELPFSNTVANALIAQPLWLGIGLLLFVAAVFVALWRAHTNPLLKRALAAVHLDREMPIVSGWYLFPTLLLAMVVYVTPETGIAGMQPSELTKSVLAFLFAIFLARWVQTNSWQLPFDRTRVPYEMIGLLIILTVTFILGSVINSDLSPAAIILLMAVGMALSLVLSGAYNFAPFLFSVAVLGLVVALLVMRGGPYGAIDVLWIAVVVLLFLPGLGAARFRRAEHISPFLMRHPISRVMDRLSTAKLMRLKNRGRYPVRVQFVALVGVAVIGAPNLWTISPI